LHAIDIVTTTTMIIPGKRERERERERRLQLLVEYSKLHTYCNPLRQLDGSLALERLVTMETTIY
jgi:hypothetical protein